MPTDSLPLSLKPSIDSAIQQTSTDNKERIISFCKIKKDIIPTNIVSGDHKSAVIQDCNNSQKVGDFHTHPYIEQALGTTPSEQDYYANLNESKIYKVKQVSCIATQQSKYIHCFEPKKIPNQQKINQYSTNDDKFFIENLYKDFKHGWYDKNTFKRVTPKIEEILDDGFGKSKDMIKSSNDIAQIKNSCKNVGGFNANDKKYKDVLIKVCYRNMLS